MKVSFDVVIQIFPIKVRGEWRYNSTVLGFGIGPQFTLRRRLCGPERLPGHWRREISCRAGSRTSDFQPVAWHYADWVILTPLIGLQCGRLWTIHWKEHKCETLTCIIIGRFNTVFDQTGKFLYCSNLAKGRFISCVMNLVCSIPRRILVYGTQLGPSWWTLCFQLGRGGVLAFEGWC